MVNFNKNNFKVDFIGVGVPKAGTTWVSQCLKEHPQICLSRPKEINFFNKNYSFYSKNKSWNYHYGIDWYKKHFIHCQQKQIKGEFSVYYFYDQEAPRLIYDNFPDVKIIIVLRNPIDRLYSHYLHAKLKGLPSFEEIIRKEKDFVEQGFYYRYIKNYLEYFSKDRILVMIYEDMKKSPLSFIQRIYNFLGVDYNYTPDSLNNIINPTAPKAFSLRFGYMKFSEKMNNKIMLSPFVKLIKLTRLNLVTRRIINDLGKKQTKYKEICPETRSELRKIYLPQIKKIEKLISRDLNFWQ